MNEKLVVGRARVSIWPGRSLAVLVLLVPRYATIGTYTIPS